MKITKASKIGNHFKRENVFLATIVFSEEYKRKMLRRRVDEKIQGKAFEELLKSFTPEQFDVFYKDEKGYTRFMETGPETFVDENFDPKGTLVNITSAWNYFSERQLWEVLVDNSYMAIIVVNETTPLFRYSKEYSEHESSQ